MNALPPFDEWIALSNHPDDPGLFFLGPYERRITFFSQQVRALRLAHALCASGTLTGDGWTAIVGAGAAGVTLAVALALLGERVTLYEKSPDILTLQSGSPRLLHPHIYEWPELGALEARAHLPLLDWNAGTGNAVCTALRLAFDAAKVGLPLLTFKPGMSLTGLGRTATGWTIEVTDDEGNATPKAPSRVVLAMGFGGEMLIGDALPNDYWGISGVGTIATEPNPSMRYIVSGNGDGGLTDLMQLLVRNFEHVAFTQRFLRWFPGDRLRNLTSTLYAGALPKEDLRQRFEATLRPALGLHNVTDELVALLRTDRRVTINSDGPLFCNGQASQLNQIMAFSLLEAAASTARPVILGQGRLEAVTHAGPRFTINGVAPVGPALAADFHHVVLRHGPNKLQRYDAAIEPFKRYRDHVQALLIARPELNAPPRLMLDTFDLFEQLRVETLVDASARPDMKAQIAARDATIIIARDGAAHILTEQGRRSLASIAEQCERLPATITIQLALEPNRFDHPADLVRLAKASNGRIRLHYVDPAHLDWRRFSDTIECADLIPSPCAPSPLDTNGLAEAVDLCLLRLLDQAVAAAIATETCNTLGAIHASICSAIEPTWADWRLTLKSDAEIRGEFLRLIAHVHQDDRPRWNGDHGLINLYAAALILMLAAHQGEALAPSLCSPGNLGISPRGVALGTGCQFLKGHERIEDWDQVDQWGVDALILSGTSETDVMPPAGNVLTGGTRSTSMLDWQRPAPVVIQANRSWRKQLAEGLGPWTAAVESEFAAWRARWNALTTGEDHDA